MEQSIGPATRKSSTQGRDAAEKSVFTANERSVRIKAVKRPSHKNPSRKCQVKSMFRIALVTYMLLLSLTGPSSCCCKLAQMTTTIASLGGVGEQAMPHVPGCCQSQSLGGASRRENRTGSENGQTNPKHPFRPCQCVKNLCGGVPSRKLDVVIDQSRSLVDDLWLDHTAPLAFVAYDLMTPAAYFACSPPPSLSGREVRVALCSWRC